MERFVSEKVTCKTLNPHLFSLRENSFVYTHVCLEGSEFIEREGFGFKHLRILFLKFS